MAQNKTNARSKRVANKKKAANRQKNETRRVESVKCNPATASLNAMMDILVGGDVKKFFEAYAPMLSQVNDLSKGEIDAYPIKAMALFSEKKDLVKRYLGIYTEVFQHEMREKDVHKKSFARNTESLVYDIMWLDVCGDDRELLGPTGYNNLKQRVDNKILNFLEVLRDNPDYCKNEGVFIPKIVFEWMRKATGVDYVKMIGVEEYN